MLFMIYYKTLGQYNLKHYALNMLLKGKKNSICVLTTTTTFLLQKEFPLHDIFKSLVFSPLIEYFSSVYKNVKMMQKEFFIFIMIIKLQVA